ncbi:hypothetical protein JIQ42_01933 [Leishmania sp. Namibia]|uniref:hypothetical protein n=1 Tax=Leishmania sp. Namibia TaxID=2802991 RepID=UPI001B6EF2EB|nr:hypothetical protein JIQ42_01933 [Leishmania sp. Namibia]
MYIGTATVRETHQWYVAERRGNRGIFKDPTLRGCEQGVHAAGTLVGTQASTSALRFPNPFSTRDLRRCRRHGASDEVSLR